MPEWERTHGPYRWTEIDATEVQRRLQSSNPPLMVDVRESYEHLSGVIPGAILLPLRQVPSRSGELDKDREIIFVCAHGMRSAEAAIFLRNRGFANVKSMAGGMTEWSGRTVPPMN